jgi:hypothetical protein
MCWVKWGVRVAVVVQMGRELIYFFRWGVRTDVLRQMGSEICCCGTAGE